MKEIFDKLKHPYIIKFIKEYLVSISIIVIGYLLYGLFAAAGAPHIIVVFIGFGCLGLFLAILLDVVTYLQAKKKAKNAEIS